MVLGEITRVVVALGTNNMNVRHAQCADLPLLANLDFMSTRPSKGGAKMIFNLHLVAHQ